MCVVVEGQASGMFFVRNLQAGHLYTKSLGSKTIDKEHFLLKKSSNATQSLFKSSKSGKQTESSINHGPPFMKEVFQTLPPGSYEIDKFPTFFTRCCCPCGEKGLSSCFDIGGKPTYLLIQLITVRCHISEFSGFKTQ